MSLVVAWLAFPAALAVLALGCGLALEGAAGACLPRALLVPAGLAAVVVVGQLATASQATAQLAAPLVVVLAAAGLALDRPWERRRPDLIAWAGAAGVFTAFAAPVVLSGQATFAGFIKLDDTATWLAITDRIMEHGRSLEGLAPSSYEATLAAYLPGGYPVGSLLGLGIGARILDVDPAWVFQPWLAFLAAMLALTLDSLLTPLVPARRARALCAFIAAQPVLLFGYALWGGVKELATAAAVALVAALAPLGRDPSHAGATTPAAIRAVLPFAVACAALLAVVSAAGVVWLAPVVGAVLATAWRRRGHTGAMALAASLAGVGVVLALPSLVLAKSFLVKPLSGNGGVFTSQVEIGNLLGPVNPLELAGIWPSGDFRVDPHAVDATHVLIAVAALAAALGLAAAVASRAWELVTYCGATLAAAVAIVAVGSPWVDAKTLAIASPAVLVAALAAPTVLWATGRRVEAGVAGAAIAGGVLWSNALGYRDANLAPRQQLRELEHIGHAAAGAGPTLLTEYNPYGARHFLRDADGEGVSELRRRLTPRRDGQPVPKSASADTDDLQLAGLFAYRTLVVRRSPVASRPPAAYRLAWRGRTYEMWQRPQAAVQPLDHLPLGGPLSAGAPAPCDEVGRLAARAGPGGVLVTVARPVPVAVALGRAPVPARWRVADASNVVPTGPATIAAAIAVPAAGRYEVWVGGSTRGRLTVAIDGRRTGSARGVLNNAGGYLPLGTASLAAGMHRLVISYDDRGLAPGMGGQGVEGFPIGPLVLSPADPSRALTEVPATEWRSLCGRSLDWIEAFPATSAATP